MGLARTTRGVCNRAVVMLIGAALLGSSPVSAATYFIQFTGVPGAIDESGGSPQSGSYSYFGGTIDVHASAATTAQPAVSAGVISGGCTSGVSGSGCAGGGFGATSKIDYQIEVIGAAHLLVPYYFETAGAISITGIGAATARVDLIAPGGLGLSGFDASSVWNGASLFCGSDGCVNSTQRILLLTNTSYTVEVFAFAGASTNSDGTISAWADPHIFIDPTFVGSDQFSLLIDGVGNSITAIPEPSTWALMLFGLGSLRFLVYRRRHPWLYIV